MQQWLDTYYWASALFFLCEIRSTLINHFQTPYILLLCLSDRILYYERIIMLLAGQYIKKREMGIMWIEWKNVLHLLCISRCILWPEHFKYIFLKEREYFLDWVNIYRFAKYSLDACDSGASLAPELCLEHAVNFQKLWLCSVHFPPYGTCSWQMMPEKWRFFILLRL